MKKIHVSLVIPVYNEATILERNVKKAIKSIEKITNEYEIIIAEDGSDDGSDLIASRLAKPNKKIIHLHSDKRLGKGLALSKAFKTSRGQILAFLDADLSADLSYLKEMTKKIELGYDFVIGSRYIKGSKTKRKFIRNSSSLLYNWLCRNIFSLDIHDFQCGFKAFKRDSLLKIIDCAESKDWFWDTEILIKGSKKGYKIVEIPIEWADREESKVKLYRDGIVMLLNILKMKL